MYVLDPLAEFDDKLMSSRHTRARDDWLYVARLRNQLFALGTCDLACLCCSFSSTAQHWSARIILRTTGKNHTQTIGGRTKTLHFGAIAPVCGEGGDLGTNNDGSFTSAG